MLKALKIVKIAEKLGGRVYARGMLFSSGYGKDIADYKKRIDPKNLLNPGKMGWNAFSMSIGLLGKLIWTA
jgi:FAD/FMN-containing dehydrogenase